MIKYVKYQNTNKSSAAYGKSFLRAVQDETVDLQGLADHMAAHDTVFSKGIVLGVLTDMARCIRELLLDSKAVKIDDLCILRLGFSCEGAATPALATVKNITGLNINSMGTGRMAVKSLINEVQYKELKKYTGLESESETEETPGSNNNSENSENSENQQSQEQVKYRITFKFADNTEDDHEYAAGETINYPTNTSGYQWPTSKPTVMPAHNVTVTEERNPNQPPPATGGGESGFD